MSSERPTAVSAVSATQITSPTIPARAPDGTLRLRGGPIEDRRVRWGQDVIDNEGMGKKSSKGTCLKYLPLICTLADMAPSLLHLPPPTSL